MGSLGAQAKGLLLGSIAMFALACGAGADGDKVYVQPDISAHVDGKTLYTKKCVVCHGPDGTRGISGASDLSRSILTREQAIDVITNGRKSMIGWEGVLSKKEIEGLAEYVETLRRP